MIVSFTLNGEAVSVRTDPDQRLIEILRTNFGLTAAKRNCLKGSCGACSVLLNGRLVPSCMVQAFAVKDQSVMTLEGFSKTWDYIDIERGFLRAGAKPCGYCAAGKILATQALLEENPEPDDREILDAFTGIRCRCTHYPTLIHAVRLSAEIRSRRRATRTL